MPDDLRERLGLCQWFHYEDYEMVERTVEVMHDLGLKHLRTGVSWADFVRPDGGQEWYDWQMRTLREAGLEVLLSVWHVPPSMSVDHTCSGPPRRLKDYADFIAQLIELYGDAFGPLELWNEPNNYLKWNFKKHDPDWALFGEMIREAAFWARHEGRQTVLGGMIPVDHHWLNLMRDHGTLEHIDVVAIHGFPEMWWPDFPNWDWYQHWDGWAQKIGYVAAHAGDRPIWITETGLATWDLYEERPARHDLQVQMLEQAAAAPAERVYWYCAIDLAPERHAIEGFHVDENEYHLGLVTYDGEKKPAYHWLRERVAAAEEVDTEASA